MLTSATGTSTSRPQRPIGGFTLIEILVVLLIIGILIAGASLSLGVLGRDSALEKESDRLSALMDYLRDQAALQNREFGLRCFVGGYEFLAYDARTGRWQRIQGEDTMRPRRLPTGLTLQVSIEGRDIILPREQAQADELAPQIMLFSSGDLNLFELTLRRAATGEAMRFAPAPDSDRIDITAVAASPA
ncbi:MAG TPA: type II secretion system minor pseudopilin GspH [Steroidobacteraceae bacterium]|nr:type II secretion system minor pseudopilin GspH [Steroidobacteraceae bacterium]